MDLPGVLEVTEFKFVQLKKIFISQEVPSTSVNLVATSSKYSLLFIGYNKGFKVISVDTVVELDETSQGKQKKDPANNYKHLDISLPSLPSCLALNCDETTLSVVIIKDDVPFALMYDVKALVSPETPYPFAEVCLSSNPGIQLRQFCWNPSIPSEFAVCVSDGAATIYGIETETLKINGILQSSEGVTALCWSPKGKQIVAGRRDGRLCQHKPNFQLSKMIPPPSAIGDNSYVASVSWLATTLFAAVFVQRNGGDNSTKLILVSVPKGQSPAYTDFGDVCFGNGERDLIYWMHHISEWKLLVCTSSNSLETAVIGYDEQGTWKQWSLEDSARAELPLFQEQETYPLGAGIVTSSTRNIIVSPTQSYPPMPILFLLSTSGILCPFHLLNLFPGQPNLVSQPEPLPLPLSTEGQRKGKAPTLPLGQPFQSSTPLQGAPPPPQEEARSNPPPDYVPAAKTNLMKKFPEETSANQENQPSFSFAKLPQMAANTGVFDTSSNKGSKFAFAPVAPKTTAENPRQPPTSSTIQTDNTQNKQAADLSSQDDGGLNRKMSRNILTPIAPSKTTSTTTSTKPPTRDVDKESVENALTIALLEELKEFTKEINESRQMLSQSKAVVGTNDEMTQIRNQTHDMKIFCDDIKKTVQSINVDVHLLKGCLFDTFAIFEEARSLDVRNKDPVYLSLLRRRALDPSSAKKLKEIRKMGLYFDSQLSEIHARLDQDWEDYLDKRKQRSKVRRNLSGVETIYRTLYNNLNAIKTLDDHVDKMINTAKEKKLSFLSSTPCSFEARKSFNEDLSSLADSLLETKISETPVSKIHHPGENPSKSVPKSLDPEKEKALKEFLMNRKVPTIKATRLSNLKDSRILSAIHVMRETSDVWKNKSHSQNVSAETDVSKSDQEVKELSLKESGVKQPNFNLTEPNWPTGMSTSGKSSFSSLASGDTVITSNTVIPVSKSTMESMFTGGITRGTPLKDVVKKVEPQIPSQASKSLFQQSNQNVQVSKLDQQQQPKSLFQQSNQAPPPNITLPFHSPPVHTVAKSNAAIVSQPIMVPIPSKSESKTASPQTSSITTNQAPVFSFGKGVPVSSSSFQFSMGFKSTEAQSSFSPTLTGFGPIKICEPTSFSAIDKPVATTVSGNEVVKTTTVSVAATSSSSNLFSFKEPTSLFPTGDSTKTSTSTGTTGSLFREIGNTGSLFKDSGTTGSLFKEPMSSGTLFKELTGATETTQSSSSSESKATSVGQYEDITPPETPSQSDSNKEEMTKVIEISVPKSTSSPEVQVKNVPTSIASGFSFKLTSQATATSSKSSFSLAHLLKSDTAGTSSVEQPPKSSGFQFGDISTKGGLAPTFSFGGSLSANKPASPTSTINSTKSTVTVTPIAVSSVITSTSSSPVISSVTASNVTIPTNASSTAFTPVTSSAEKEASTDTSIKETEQQVPDIVAKEESPPPPPPSSSPPKESDIENKPEVIPPSPKQDDQPPPPPPYPTGQAAFPISTTTPSTAPPTFGPGSSLFGKPSPSRNLFGQSTSETSFGTPTTTQTTGSLFGNLTSFGQAKPATFGQPQPAASTAAAPVFGSVSTSNTPFGTPNTAPVGIFGQPAQQQQTPGFGSPATSQSFGQTTPSSGFGAFGQQNQQPTFSQANASFGQSPGGAFSIAKPLFGQSGSTVFGQANKTTTSPSRTLFGQQSPGSIFDQNTSFFGGLGGQPSAENANKNVFGVPSFQNQSPSSGSGLFGNQGSGGFGNKFGNTSFTGGSFSAGGTSVAETGFGAFGQTEQQKTPTKIATGASPGFGAPPVFGGSPIFGSNTFGISPVQQNPNAFGGSFGSPSTAATPMFDALASQAPTFGSLSQQPTAAPTFGSGGSVFGSSQSFGSPSSGIGSQSSAFTQWRQ